jgi:hypothetical protein
MPKTLGLGDGMRRVKEIALPYREKIGGPLTQDKYLGRRIFINLTRNRRDLLLVLFVAV